MNKETKSHNYVTYIKYFSDVVAILKQKEESLRNVYKRQSTLCYKVASKQNNTPTEQDIDQFIALYEEQLSIINATLEKLENIEKYLDNNLV